MGCAGCKAEAAERALEFSNDFNSDPSVKHSRYYDLGYARGKAAGVIETHQQDFPVLLETNFSMAAKNLSTST